MIPLGLADLVLVVAIGACIAVIVPNLRAHVQEARFLRRVANEHLGEPPASRDHLVRLLMLLQSRVSYEGLDKNASRPLLRQTAFETFTSGRGFCGENSRLAIRLMAAVGIPAARIYVSGERWSHVLTECRLDGQWWLFDGLNDPETCMSPADVCSIESPRIDRLRTHRVNPYIDFQRIRLFRNRLLLNRFRRVRLPNWVVQVFESPNLIKAGLGAGGIVVALIVWRLT